LDRIFPPSQSTAANPVGISKENESALKKFLGWAESATVILLPIKDEAALGADNPYTRLAKMLLSRLGVNYQSCSISPDHFLPHDGHPSEAGYAQVGECLQ
jgi:hypothetical protein